MRKKKKEVKKKKEKQNVQEAGWATAHLPMLGHDTRNCVVAQGLEGGSTAHSRRTAARHDIAGQGHDTVE